MSYSFDDKAQKAFVKHVREMSSKRISALYENANAHDLDKLREQEIDIVAQIMLLTFIAYPKLNVWGRDDLDELREKFEKP